MDTKSFNICCILRKVRSCYSRNQKCDSVIYVMIDCTKNKRINGLEMKLFLSCYIAQAGEKAVHLFICQKREYDKRGRRMAGNNNNNNNSKRKTEVITFRLESELVDHLKEE